MSLLDLESIQEEVLRHGEFKTINVLVRPGKWSGRGQVPAVMFLTKETMFYGGSQATKGKFNRIPLKSVNKVSVVGKLFLKCVEVEYMSLGGLKKIYFCPFTGEPHQPSIDEEKTRELYDTIKKALE